MGNFSYIISSPGNPIHVHSKDRLTSSSKAGRSPLEHFLGLNENTTAVLVDTLTDFVGGYHESYKEYYNGIEVEGTRCTIHYNPSGDIVAINGNFRTICNINIIPSVTEFFALQSALSNVGAQKYAWEDSISEGQLKEIKKDKKATSYPQAKLVIYAQNNTISLAYKFCIRSIIPEACYDVYVEANSGNVIEKVNTTNEFASNGIVSTFFSGQQTIVSDYHQGNYRLRDYTRGSGIETYRYVSQNFQERNDYYSINNTWSALTTTDRAALDVHWGMEKTYDYFYQKFGRNSYDNNGGKLVSFVNRFNWSNAAYYRSDTIFVFGNYGNIPFVDIDIVAHELTHSITHHTSHLGNTGEAGAINEALSDVFAIGLKNEGTPINSLPNWVICDNPAINFSRNLQNPTCKFYCGTGWVDDLSSYDNGGVHTNLGVFCYWFYLLSNGGSGVNEVGDSYTIEGIGMDHALRICYLMNTAYLTSNSDYLDACRCSYLAAEQLGYTDIDTQLRSAWTAVGVQRLLDAFIAGPDVLCRNSYYTVEELPSTYTVSWHLGDVNNSYFAIPYTNNNFSEVWASNYNASRGDTLKATISYNGMVIETLSKKIYTHTSFLSITGTQAEYQDDNSYYYPEQSISYSALNATNGYSSNQIPINADCDISLNSSRFKGMNITFEGNYLPTNVSCSENQINFHTSPYEIAPFPLAKDTPSQKVSLIPSISYPLIMRVTSTDDCKNFTLNFSVSPIPYLNDAELEVNVVGNNLSISFYEPAPIPIGGGQYQLVNWQLNIINTETWQQLFSQNVTGNHINVNISNWPSGLYSIHAIYNGVIHVAKFYK